MVFRPGWIAGWGDGGPFVAGDAAQPTQQPQVHPEHELTLQWRYGPRICLQAFSRHPSNAVQALLLREPEESEEVYFIFV